MYDAAEALSDELGFRQLTLAGLAKKLGVKTPSLYKHVESLEAIQIELQRRAYINLTDRVKKYNAGGRGREAVILFTVEYRRFALERPGLYGAMVVSHVGRGLAVEKVALELLAFLPGFLKEMGLQGDDLIHAARTIRSSIHGFIELEREQGFGLEQKLEASFQFMLTSLLKGLN